MIHGWVELQCDPLNDLERCESGEIWSSTGDDPQFLLKGKILEQGNLKGWIQIELSLEFIENARCPCIYLDEGKGMSEQQKITFPIPENGVTSKIIYFHRAIKALRLDPTNCESKFHLHSIRIKRISRYTAVLAVMRPYPLKVLQRPIVYLSFAIDILKLWLLQGNLALRLAVRELITTQNGTVVRNYVTTQLAFARHKARKDKNQANTAKGINKIAWLRGRRKRLHIGIGLIEHFGDIIACEPVVRYLRKKYPKAEISWVVRHDFRELIDHNPYIDNTIAVDCLTDWIKWRSHNHFDRVFDLHVNGRVCPHCLVVLNKKEGDSSITGENYYFYGSLLKAFSLSAGLPPLDDTPRVFIPEETKKSVDRLGLPEQFIAVHCRSNEVARDWDYNKWIPLAQEIIQITGHKILEIGLIPVIADKLEGVVNLCAKTSLLETAEIIRRAVAFVGIDSGPAHFANALSTPSVILLGQLARFNHYTPFSGDFGSGKGVILVRNLEGPAAAIPVADVIRSVKTLLEQNSKPPEERDAGLFIEDKTSLLTQTSLSNTPRVLALYLPQYYPIPENDKAWGKGFTEWRNVGRAKTYYDGQYQPRLPGEFGYYDLRLPEIMEQQAALAQEYGVHGFCYYLYWFNGRRLLHLPLDNMLRSGRPNFPFCYCWANENWTRRWDGMNKEILIAQNHTPKDDLNFIRFIMPALDDPRYIRVNGKPLLLIYRTELFPDPARTAELWREEVHKAGLGDLYLVRCEGFDPFTNPEDIGFDAAYEVPTFILPDDLLWKDLKALNVSQDFMGRIFDYDRIVHFYTHRPDVSYKRFKGISLAWDNTPRHGNRAVIFHGVTPEKYGLWLQRALEYSFRRFPGNERIIFINAWNEWAEGSYLEPDLKFGRGFLEATTNAINQFLSNQKFDFCERSQEAPRHAAMR